MAGTTATQGFPYPTASDRAVDFPADAQAYAQAVDAKLTSLDSTISGINIPPMCRMSISTPVVVPLVSQAGILSGNIPFDTVDVDTAGMCDLSKSIYSPFATVSGYYSIGFWLNVGPTGATDSAGQIMITPNYSSFQIRNIATAKPVTRWDSNGGFQMFFSFRTNAILDMTQVGPTMPLVPFFPLQFQKNGSASYANNPQMITSGMMWAYKIRNYP